MHGPHAQKINIRPSATNGQPPGGAIPLLPSRTTDARHLGRLRAKARALKTSRLNPPECAPGSCPHSDAASDTTDIQSVPGGCACNTDLSRGRSSPAPASATAPADRSTAHRGRAAEKARVKPADERVEQSHGE
eukprot:363700-Chlamydomonas_euryale.AAC.4